MKQLYVRGRDVDPVVPDMKACTDTSKPEQSPLGRRPLDPKDGALLTAAAMATAAIPAAGLFSLSGDAAVGGRLAFNKGGTKWLRGND